MDVFPRMRLLVMVMVICHHVSQALNIKRVTVPHDIEPGHIIARFVYWGQNFRIDSLASGMYSRYFSVSPHGQVMPNSPITHLKGENISLVIINELAGESWRDSVHLSIQDSRHLIVFPKHSYVGHILENQPGGTLVAGLDDIVAKITEGNKKVFYTFTSGPMTLFEISEHVDGKNHIQIVSKVPLDREQRSHHVLSIKAVSDDVNDEPGYAKIIVNVDDQNDNVPRFEKSHYIATLTDATPPLSTIVQVKAVDPDDGKIKYLMEPHKYFRIDPDHGHIILKSRHGLEANQYQLRVYAEDSGGVMSDHITVDVQVTSALHFEPVHMRQRRSTHAVKEYDVPELQEGTLIRLTTGSHEHRFDLVEPLPPKLEIDSESGAVSLRQGERLDYEEETDILFTVLITSIKDTKGNAFSSTIAVTNEIHL